MLVVLLAEEKHYFFLSFLTWTGDKDKYKNSIGIWEVLYLSQVEHGG